jgi:hypothetical protein
MSVFHSDNPTTSFDGYPSQFVWSGYVNATSSSAAVAKDWLLGSEELTSEETSLIDNLLGGSFGSFLPNPLLLFAFQAYKTTTNSHNSLATAPPLQMPPTPLRISSSAADLINTSAIFVSKCSCKRFRNLGKKIKQNFFFAG